jgi:glycosyltransferase involved in cell wall biosynthesis
LSIDLGPSCAVIVPSFRRPLDLARCLQALAEQTRRPDQVIVVVRGDDQATRDVVISARADLRVTEQLVARGGQVAALNAGLEAVVADVTAITDDDTAPHNEWISGLLKHFADPAVAGVGGRDLVLCVAQPEQWLVGRVEWHGRIVGNHHLGVGPSRSVDILKGANMAFRTAWLRRFGFDERLRGDGAQVHNDLMLSLRIKGAGGTLVYDPQIRVDHHIGERPAGDDRVDPKFGLISDEVHNETLALMEFLPPSRRVAHLVWATLLGTRRTPGLGVAIALLPMQKLDVCEAFLASVAGRVTGVRSWLRGRRVALSDGDW